MDIDSNDGIAKFGKPCSTEDSIGVWSFCLQNNAKGADQFPVVSSNAWINMPQNVVNKTTRLTCIEFTVNGYSYVSSFKFLPIETSFGCSFSFPGSVVSAHANTANRSRQNFGGWLPHPSTRGTGFVWSGQGTSADILWRLVILRVGVVGYSGRCDVVRLDTAVRMANVHAGTNVEENILYDLTIHAEWPLEPEITVCMKQRTGSVWWKCSRWQTVKTPWHSSQKIWKLKFWHILQSFAFSYMEWFIRREF